MVVAARSAGLIYMHAEFTHGKTTGAAVVAGTRAHQPPSFGHTMEDHGAFASFGRGGGAPPANFLWGQLPPLPPWCCRHCTQTDRRTHRLTDRLADRVVVIQTARRAV